MDLIDLCQKIRDYINAPVYINSGYRCPYYNQVVGGVFNSYHVQGLAADIRAEMGARALFDFIREMYSSGLIPELSFCYLYQKKNFTFAGIVAENKIKYRIEPATNIDELAKVRVYRDGDAVGVEALSSLGNTVVTGTITLYHRAV